MKPFKILFLLTLVLTTVLFSCKKDESKSKNDGTLELATTDQVSVADDQVTDGIITALDAADGAEDGNADLRPVTCTTISTNTDLKKITIDFGTGCTNPFTGRTRSGKIIVGYTGDNYLTATERTIKFENYKTVDTVTLNGEVKQTSIVRSGNTVSFTLTAENLIFAFPGTKKHTIIKSTRNCIIDLGENLRDFSDNTTTISGNTVGVNKEGMSYSVDIITPVVFKGTCTAEHIFYPSAGVYDIKVANNPKFTLTWGNGECDKIVTIVYLGISINVVLK